MNTDTPIAVVGLAYRAPGVGGKGLWEYLAEAKSAWSKVPANRFEQDAYYHPDSEKKGNFSSKGAHFLPDDVFAFDAPFFNLRPDEARAVDPHHRLMLEVTLEAAESAGLSLTDLAGANIGVFAASGTAEYGQQTADDLPTTTTWAATGNAPCMFANRLSYFFNLDGPSIALDAACASSSYAVHLACQSLRAGECNAAVVSASSLLLGPNQWVMLDNMGALSPEGKSFSYDTKASGFGRGEGGATLLVKRLDDAIKNGDPIRAVIRNSACNHSGRSDGITMPSRAAQEKLLRRVHEEVGLDPSQTPVVEGHGTGTQAGDPIEAGAFATVLGGQRSSTNPLYIGSLKSNFGHLEGASGILAMIKAIMMINRGYILPTAHFKEFNKNIEGRDRLMVPQTATRWPENELRRVCVTNFGFGGSNAAVIFEAASTAGGPAPALTNGSTHTNGAHLTNGHSNGVAQNNGVAHTNGVSHLNGNGVTNGVATNGHHHDSQQRLFVLSAKTEGSLAAYLKALTEYLENEDDSNKFAKDLSFTLGQRRSHHPYRTSVVADSIATLKTQLPSAKISKIKDRTLAFAFTGQGAQHAQMASGLRHYKIFASAIDQAEAHLNELGATWSLTEELERPEKDSRVNDAEISQPACSAVQLALVLLLRSWGITPATVTGHSSGEIAAAFAAGLLSFRAAIAVAYFRGQGAAQLSRENGPKGAMLALGAGFEEASALLNDNTEGYATVAAINSPQSVTVSGDVSAIENIQRIAEERGLFARKLKVELAYHSRHMEPVAASYLESIKPFCDLQPETSDQPRPIFVSSVTGRVESADSVDASYWVKNLLQPVRFADAIEASFSPRKDKANLGQLVSPNVVIEIGPHGALKNPIKQTLAAIRQQTDQRQQFGYLASLVRGTSGDEALLELAGSLFSMGSPIQTGLINQTSQSNARVLPELPPYVWDKSSRYLLESRVTKEKLHPGVPYDTFLGWKTPSTGANEHTFRQVFTLDDMAWIRDHDVGGNVVFPMTGYMSLAIEALRRVSPTVPSSIVIREFYAKRSLGIEEDERVDITTKLKAASTGTEAFSTTAWSFEILSWAEETGWAAHCHGLIEADVNDLTIEGPIFKPAVPLIGSSELKERSVENEYTVQSGGGTIYGPAFRTMVKLWDCPGWAVLDSELRDMDLSTSSPYGSLITVDPPTLDGFLHGFGPLQEIDGKRPTQMPNYVSRFRISNNIPQNSKQKFTSVTRLIGHDVKAGSLRISAANFAIGSEGELIPVAEWETVAFRSIGSPDAGDSGSNLPATYYWDHVPSLDFANDGEVEKVLPVDAYDENELPRRRQLNRAAVHYMDRAIKETAGDDLSNLPSHLARFVNWSKGVAEREMQNTNGDASSILAGLPSDDAHCEMIRVVGEQLVPILRGEIQPLEIMLKDGLLNRYYDGDEANARVSELLARYVRHLANVKADLRVLEIGAGTGSATLPVLEHLSRGEEGLPALVSYTFTDISTGFFESAREKLSKWEQHLIFKKLDVGQDPVQQGFNLEDYDLIIASNVLHATPNMATTLNNVKSLLQPGGKLLLLEAVQHQPLSLPFALLPGWWLTEDDYRDQEIGPLLSEETWQRLLSDTGFTGVDKAIGDYPGMPEHLLSVICSTKVGAQDESLETAPITICGPMMDDEEAEFAELVSNSITETLGYPCDIKPFAEVDPADDQFCIFIDSPRNSIVRDMPSETFDIVKSVLLEAKGVLWIAPEGHSPEAVTMKGMLRSLRLETESSNLLWLEGPPCTEQGAVAITKLAKRLRDTGLPSTTDQDFVWRDDDMIYLPRFRQLTEAKESFASETGSAIRKVQNIWEGEGSLEMTIDAAGSPDSIYFRRTDLASHPISDDEVLIKVSAAGVNFRDLLLVLGSIPWTTPGFEGAGVVVKAGSKVTDLQIGDRVSYATLEGGSFGTHFKIPSWRAQKIPDQMSDAEAASIPVAYSTAVMALLRIGRLRTGESVLIHAASGAVGQACIVLAQHVGASRIFVTAGSDAKRDFLHDTFGIPREHIFSSRTPEFRDGIMAATSGQGVDVVVNSLSGDLLRETWSLVAEFGRFMEIGKKDLLQNSHLAMRPFDRNVTFSGIDLRAYFTKREDELRECLADMADLVQRGVIVPIKPVNILPVSELATGLRKLQSGQNIGKIVVTMGPDECVLAESAPPPALALKGSLLRADATYVITGGTGGIGLSLGAWMAENGARNVVLLGRSGSSRPETKKLLDQYEGTDVNMKAIACDVGSKEELESALQSVATLPPVRGVVHGALYLRDATLPNTTHEDWQNVTRPRVRGAFNLHELLPDLDFFVVLSSFLGSTGNIGQSVYAGTNTFFDAFAGYRTAQGLPTVSIALPVVLGIGYAVDHNLIDALKGSLGATLDEAQVKALVKGAIIGPSSNLNRDGKSVAGCFVSGEDRVTRPWQCFHPRTLVSIINAKQHSDLIKNAGPGRDTRTTGLANASDEDLLEALISKVSSITMIERDEVEADAPLAKYSLDSLVSVELRNWIRRETRVELPLPKIVGAANLRALATHILSLRDKS